MYTSAKNWTIEYVQYSVLYGRDKD